MFSLLVKLSDNNGAHNYPQGWRLVHYYTSLHKNYWPQHGHFELRILHWRLSTVGHWLLIFFGFQITHVAR